LPVSVEPRRPPVTVRNSLESNRRKTMNNHRPIRLQVMRNGIKRYVFVKKT
jgi:hypothetical protein